MKKKQKVFYSELDEALSKKIYLNVNHLEKGHYVLKIMHKQNVIKKVTFRKG